MKILMIGGTGNISTACTKLALNKGIEVVHLNRGSSSRKTPEGVETIKCDISKTEEVKAILGDRKFDVVANFIAFKPTDVQRDFELFKGKCGQYIFISSASVYQRPMQNPFVTESTPLKNPYWDYSRDKIACEDLLHKLYREENFPMTIIRPSHTYETVIPVAIGSWEDYTLIDRMKKGKPVLVHGDGSSLWTITHSRDFAKGFVGICDHQQAIGESFHITSDEVLNWNQIYEDVAAAAGVEPKLVHVSSDFICRVADSLGQEWMRGNLFGDKATSTIFDNSKIKHYVPDFLATIPFKQGIKETLNWFEADPHRMKIVDENNELIDLVVQKYTQSLKSI